MFENIEEIRSIQKQLRGINQLHLKYFAHGLTGDVSDKLKKLIAFQMQNLIGHGGCVTSVIYFAELIVSTEDPVD